MNRKVEEQFLKAYEEYAEAIYRHCYFRVFNKQRAEELMQDTFTKTWLYLSRGKKVDNLRAFLYRVAGNLVIDESRKNKMASLEAWLEAGEGENDIPTEGHKDILRSAMAKEVVRAMDRLDKDDQEILTLRFVSRSEERRVGKECRL